MLALSGCALSVLRRVSVGCALACALAFGCGDGANPISPSGDNPDGAPGQMDDGGSAGADARTDPLPPNEGGTPPDGNEGGAPDADASEPDSGPPPDAPIVGIAFEPVITRTSDGQTVQHMELTGLTFMPGDRGVLVHEKAGRVSHYAVSDDGFTLLGEFTLPDIYRGGDCGLVALALDPDWESNHFLFASHCTSGTHSGVTRFVFDGSDYESVAETASPVIVQGDSRASKAWHNVGTLGFFDDPEHSMWVLFGEKTEGENAQDVTTQLGAMLRIIPRRDGEGYDPHPDNPFYVDGADPETMSGLDVYAWGFRSPWRAVVDDHNRVWVGDVGSNYEEVNLVSEPGQNFGWAEVEGSCRGDDPPCEYVDPVVRWNRSGNHSYRLDDGESDATSKRCASIGTLYRPGGPDVYRGFLDDSLLFSDMCLGWVRAVALDDDGAVVRDDHVGHLVGLSGGAQGPDGYVYVTSFGSCSSATLGIGGGLYRVIPRYPEEPTVTPPPATRPLTEDPLGPFPARLSQTGAFSAESPTTPIEGAIVYEPTLQLWSDGMDKQRFMLLPPGTKVDNTERTAWEFPPGTLFFKTFSDGPDKPVETRVIRRTEQGWDYHVYLWAGSDADLLAGQRPIRTAVALGDHFVPSEFDCRTCHESNGTVVIGFDELRLNGPGAGITGSQLETFAEAGVFEHPLPATPDAVEHADATTREVLGYLHGNCAHCHNGSGNTMSTLDLSHGVALANVIGVPTQGNGQADGIRVVPGDPLQSILFLAFSGEGTNMEVQAMPPVGVQERDASAVELLRTWITGLPTD